jgi:hypothetical protein
MKIYVTKYALKMGIQELDADEITGSRAWINSRQFGTAFGNYFCGNDWHKTKAEAIARANQMRDQKIASLRKQIAQLEAMTFGE